MLIVATHPPLRRPFDDAQFSQPAKEQQQQQQELQQVQVDFALLGLFYDLACILYIYEERGDRKGERGGTCLLATHPATMGAPR